MDMAFTPGVLAFTRVITVDVTGIQIGSSAVASELGQILDSDVYFTPAIQTLRLLPLKPIGGSYTVYAEALNGVANPSQSTTR